MFENLFVKTKIKKKKKEFKKRIDLKKNFPWVLFLKKGSWIQKSHGFLLVLKKTRCEFFFFLNQNLFYSKRDLKKKKKKAFYIVKIIFEKRKKDLKKK